MSGKGGRWNRAGRKSGGNRPAKIVVPPLDLDLVRLLRQIRQAEHDFGPEAREVMLRHIERTQGKPAADAVRQVLEPGSLFGG